MSQTNKGMEKFLLSIKEDIINNRVDDALATIETYSQCSAIVNKFWNMPTQQNYNDTWKDLARIHVTTKYQIASVVCVSNFVQDLGRVKPTNIKSFFPKYLVVFNAFLNKYFDGTLKSDSKAVKAVYAEFNVEPKN